MAKKKGVLIKTKTKKSEKRVEVIVETATELFLENGFANTSLREIVQKSGGSLSTIYERFDNKDGLFMAVIQQVADKILTYMDDKISANNNENLEEFLHKFAQAYIKIEFDERYMFFKRIVFSEIQNKGEKFFYAFHRQIFRPMHQILIDFFSKPSIKPIFNGQNLNVLSARFCFILIEPFSTDKILFNKPFSMDENERNLWIKECVKFFLNGVKATQ